MPASLTDTDAPARPARVVSPLSKERQFAGSVLALIAHHSRLRSTLPTWNEEKVFQVDDLLAVRGFFLADYAWRAYSWDEESLPVPLATALEASGYVWMPRRERHPQDGFGDVQDVDLLRRSLVLYGYLRTALRIDDDIKPFLTCLADSLDVTEKSRAWLKGGEDHPGAL